MDRPYHQCISFVRNGWSAYGCLWCQSRSGWIIRRQKQYQPLIAGVLLPHPSEEPGARMTIPTDPTHNAFLYLISGEMELESQRSLWRPTRWLCTTATPVILNSSETGANSGTGWTTAQQKRFMPTVLLLWITKTRSGVALPIISPENGRSGRSESLITRIWVLRRPRDIRTREG